jgi:serine/threonine protein kinase
MKFEKYEECEDEGYNGELVGTAEYIAPEALENKNVGIGVDIWALGCILYLFMHGKTPFKDRSDLLIFENILNKDVVFDEVVIIYTGCR